MTGSRRYLIRMLIFLAAVALGVSALLAPMITAFTANSGLNGLIVGVLFIGIVYIFRQVFVLMKEARWLDGFRAGRTSISGHASGLRARFEIRREGQLFV